MHNTRFFFIKQYQRVFMRQESHSVSITPLNTSFVYNKNTMKIGQDFLDIQYYSPHWSGSVNSRWRRQRSARWGWTGADPAPGTPAALS